MSPLLNRILSTKHLALLLILVLIVGVTGIGGYFLKQKKAWKAVQEEITQTTYLSTLKTKKQSINTIVRQHYCDADPLYLEHAFQGFCPLSHELVSLERLTQNSNYTGADSVESRLVFLKEGKNKITVLEKSAHTGENIRETLETLSHPVEVDTDDVRDILKIVEEDCPLKPQLIIKDFQLVRKVKPSGNEVYDMHLSLIKREFEKI